jgi:hypothetical protein
VAKIAIGWDASFSRPAFDGLGVHVAQHFGGFGAIEKGFDNDLIRFHSSVLSGLAGVRLRPAQSPTSCGQALRLHSKRCGRALIGVPRTYLVPEEAEDANQQTVSLPVQLKPEFRFEKTNLLSRVVEKWQEIPIGLLQHLDLRKSLYGYIGLEDRTLYPMIRPGSLVQIDPSQRKVILAQWRTEFERPIYFIELRNGYVCGWCEIDRGQLVVVPHPQSRESVRQFAHPSQAEIVGRVTGVAMRIVGDEDAPGGAVLR